jgi:hypothetical protein
MNHKGRKKSPLEISVMHSVSECWQAKEALGQEEGERLWQLVYEEGHIAVMHVWCAAACHLKDRDEARGWYEVTRSERLSPCERTPDSSSNEVGEVQYVGITSNFEAREAAHLAGNNGSGVAFIELHAPTNSIGNANLFEE